MGNKNASTNFPHARRRREHEGHGYNTPEYYNANRSLSRARQDQRAQFPNEDLNTEYDDLNTGKSENYQGAGYYGGEYGNMAEWGRGRDYETNAGYRENYNRLTTGQWPGIERAAQMRGIGPNEGERASRGLHRGKGPRSYQRSDERIIENVHDVLLEDAYVDASDIEVKVERGEVILTGEVDTKNEKRRAEDIIQDLRGIKHLENRLRARKPGSPIVNIENSKR